ncbi:Bestrophin/UPF0187 [Gautieria morchelliformis]|nr:Bestrophin/UPF0187 [Gautieria morchelliformis]
MSRDFSVASLASVIIKPPIKRRHLRKYSWLPDVFRIQGSILIHILGPVLTVTIFATGIATAFHYGYPVTLTNSVTPLLAVVVGLILVFRNTTSYDRYYEGRKDFGSMMSTIRNLSRLIWINVNITDPKTNAPSSTPLQHGSDKRMFLSSEKLTLEKVRTIRLLLSYAYAVKHHLRGEDGIAHKDYDDVFPAGFPRFDQATFAGTANTAYSTVSVGSQSPALSRKVSGRAEMWNSQTTAANSSTPLLTDAQTVEISYALPLPMLITHEVTRMIYKFKRLGYLDVIGPAGTNAMTQLCASLSDQLTAMERIANTPIPSFYGVHLKQSVTLYLFALPFTLVKELGWRMIPVVTVVAITLMGIEGIADEIEMPFGSGTCDLPLDDYCKELKHEVEYLITRLPQGIEEEDTISD